MVSDLMVQEEQALEEYIQENGITVEPTSSGLYFIEETTGDGNSPDEGDYVLINYSLYMIENDQLVFSTYQDLAQLEEIFDDRVLYGPYKIEVGQNLPGLDEGLSLMREGGEASLLLPSYLGYGDSEKGPVGPYSPLRIDVELIEVIEDPAEAEYEKMMKFLNTREYPTDTTKEGIYYIETESGETDVSVEFGDYVGFEITGKLLDGRIFYQSSDLIHELGTDASDVPMGLNYGLTYMQEGSSAIIVVPYYYGYGELGYTYYNGYVKTPIPPYSTLVYEVTLNKIP